MFQLLRGCVIVEVGAVLYLCFTSHSACALARWPSGRCSQFVCIGLAPWFGICHSGFGLGGGGGYCLEAAKKQVIIRELTMRAMKEPREDSIAEGT